jgi:preprotein translocase subunit SecD
MSMIVIVLAGACIYGVFLNISKDDQDAWLKNHKEKKITALKLGLDIQGGLQMNLEVDRDKMQGKSEQEISDAADRALEILRNRIDGLGVTEPVLEREGTGGIVIQLPGLTDTKRARDVILSTAQLQFRLVSEIPISQYINEKDGSVEVDKLPEGITYLPGKDQEKYLCEKILLTGESLVDAHVETDMTTGSPHIAFKLNDEGGKQFGIITGDNVQRQLAIVLDDRVYSAPTIQSRIPGGSGIITGHFSDEEAADLALILKAGALPAPLKVTSQFIVGPTLGADSVKKGTMAALYGLLLVLLFMGIYYRWSGWIANAGLIMNMVYLMGLLAFLKVTITLPGIAGIILTLGLSVDSNVLIFERIREELRAGKTTQAAIDAGYKRALQAIIDTHVTTLISAIFLFQFGTGPIKGFAVNLSLGVALSLFTAVVITKMIFDVRKERRQSLSI